VACFERIAADSAIGSRRRDAFRPTMRSVPFGPHAVSCLELDGGVIGLFRILHAWQIAAALRWSEGLRGWV
jgi:plasmid stabilization system protein ParE